VDYRPVMSPYEVAAIGPDDLERTFNHTAAAAGMADLASQYGLGFTTRIASPLTLPAAPGSTLRYAQPVPSASGATR
jgi:hypothetical protein